MGRVDMPSGQDGEVEDDAEQQDEHERRSRVVDPAGQGTRLDRWLVQMASEFSRNHLQSLVERGCVTIDGQPVRKDARKLRLGERVEVELQPTAESRAYRAEAIDFETVFEDEHLLVANKVPGMVVHPAAGNWSGTLMNALLAHHEPAFALPRAGIVHRLDKDTSGLIVVGKTLPAVTALQRMIAAREVHREYFALALGRLEAPQAIDAPLRRDPVSRVKMAIGLGKPARTDVFPIAGGETEGRSVTAVHCVLHSGRTHQIRVHLASRGHPLVGDVLYGGAALLGLTRQALHAARLSFVHPITQAPMRLEAPLPDDLRAACEEAGLPEVGLPGELATILP